MKDLLATYYDIQPEEKVILDNREGYKSGEYLYFTILAENSEAIHMEQAALSYYLNENNLHTAIPIPAKNGQWIINYREKAYFVMRVQITAETIHPSNGKALADFHQIGTMYRYEPNEISSYGQWKDLWIRKLTMFEQKALQEADEHPTDYYRLLMDILPYIIGISENAIQYVQETEQDYRFDDVDRGTITFKRCRNNLQRPIIWTDDLVYDHPARDLAEFIRNQFLKSDRNVESEVAAFLHDYQKVRPLSVFSWRLLYARLIFPIHLFDIMERGFSQRNFDQLHQNLHHMLDRQTGYEKRLGQFFQKAAINHEALQIPVLHWL